MLKHFNVMAVCLRRKKHYHLILPTATEAHVLGTRHAHSLALPYRKPPLLQLNPVSYPPGLIKSPGHSGASIS